MNGSVAFKWLGCITNFRFHQIFQSTPKVPSFVAFGMLSCNCIRYLWYANESTTAKSSTDLYEMGKHFSHTKPWLTKRKLGCFANTNFLSHLQNGQFRSGNFFVGEWHKKWQSNKTGPGRSDRRPKLRTKAKSKTS